MLVYQRVKLYYSMGDCQDRWVIQKKVSHYRDDRGFWNTAHVARTFSVCLQGCLKQVSSAMTGLVAYMIS